MNTHKEKEVNTPNEGKTEYKSKLSDPKKKEQMLKSRLSPNSMGRERPGPSKNQATT